MNTRSMKGWLYLIPAMAFLGVFVVYPLFDVIVYSFEEGYNSASQTFFGTGIYNFQYVLRDPYFIQALKNTFILVIVTVPLSTLLALLISVGLSSIKKLQELYQTIFFLQDPLHRRFRQPDHPLLWRQHSRLHRRTVLGQDDRHVHLHHLGGHALQDPDSHQRTGVG